VRQAIRPRCRGPRRGHHQPAAGGKRSFWSSRNHSENPDDWLAQAQEERGSWWPEWSRWLEKFKAARTVKTRAAPERTGSAQYPAIEAAPGRYVNRRHNQETGVMEDIFIVGARGPRSASSAARSPAFRQRSSARTSSRRR